MKNSNSPLNEWRNENDLDNKFLFKVIVPISLIFVLVGSFAYAFYMMP